MKKKALALAVAGALVSPAAFAAQDTSGMQYTSAAEGFYASIRARYNSSGGKTGDDASIGNSSTRFGVRGTNDLGGGMSGFYQLEFGSDINNGGGTSVRVGHVGLRGAFGSIRVGSGWNHLYNNVYGSTDIANVGSGNLVYNNLYPGRTSNAIQYDSPNLNGFSVGFDAQLDGNTGPEDAGMRATSDGNDVDRWGISATYDVAGFSVGAAYNTITDGIMQAAWDDVNPVATGSGAAANVAAAAVTEDSTMYALKAGYAQDNWYVNTWYGEDNNEDKNRPGEENNTIFSIGGGIAVDKVNVYFVHENREYGYATHDGSGDYNATTDAPASGDEAYSTFGVQYNMGANTRVWVEYAARDNDDSDVEDDTVTIGLRHDF